MSVRLMYHTQEARDKRLENPVLCTREDAWLGEGYYFWLEEEDAAAWGSNSKANTGFFEIYTANIDCQNVLDTVYNEEHYTFWRKQIEKAAAYIYSKTNRMPSIASLNSYFKERANWKEKVTGVMFQDLPINNQLVVRNFNYRKRIQLAAYMLNIINDFSFHKKDKVQNK